MLLDKKRPKLRILYTICNARESHLEFFFAGICVKAARVVLLVLVRKLLYIVTGKASFLTLYPYVHKRHQIRNNKLQLGHKYVLNLTKSFILNSRMKAILVCVYGRPTEIIDI